MYRETVAVTVALIVFSILGTLWVRGYDVVKRNSPKSIPTFYYVSAAIRVAAVLLLIIIYSLFSTPESTKLYAAIVMVMYAVMMVVSLIIKH